MKKLRRILLISVLLLIISIIVFLTLFLKKNQYDYKFKSTFFSQKASKASILGYWEVVNKINYDKIKRNKLKGDIKPAYLYYGVTLAGFFNEKFGITVGPDDDIRYTTDAGKTWTKSINELFCRHGLEIVNEKISWNGGNGGTKVSSDRCKTWRKTSLSSDIHVFLSFLDEKTGWAASPYFLKSTIDGGITWNNIILPSGIQFIAAIDLFTTEKGYLLDTVGNLYITKDGGKSWSTASLGLNADDQIPASTISPMAALRFTDEMHGIAVFDLMDKDKTVWFAVTRDGGHTWQRDEIKELKNQSSSYYHLFLSNNGKLLTATDDFYMGKNTSVVLRYYKP